MEQFTRNDQRAIAAEFLATMFFVFFATGAVVAAVSFGDAAALVTISVTFGFSLMVGVAWAAGISGGHLNPAVTIAMLIAGKIKTNLAIAYIVAQMLGALVASLVLLLCTGDFGDDVNLGATTVNEDLAVGRGLILEAVMTAFLVWVIFSTAVSKRGWENLAPFAIGMAVMIIHFVGVPFTGPSVNPARTFGPAVVSNEWSDFWIYYVGPVAGAVVAALGWNFWRTLGEEDLDPEGRANVARTGGQDLSGTVEATAPR